MVGRVRGPRPPAQREALAGAGLSGGPWCARTDLAARGQADPAAGGKVPSSPLRPVNKEALVCDAGQEREEMRPFGNL